jgi:hypothetical protein
MQACHDDFSHNELGWIAISSPFSAGILISAISSKEKKFYQKKQTLTLPNIRSKNSLVLIKLV